MGSGRGGCGPDPAHLWAPHSTLAGHHPWHLDHHGDLAQVLPRPGPGLDLPLSPVLPNGHCIWASGPYALHQCRAAAAHPQGPFYRYRTYHDWLHQGPAVPSLEPLLLRARPAPFFGLLFLLSSWLFPLEAVREDAFYSRSVAFRLFYMVPVFFAFRMRFYVAWIAAECDCIAAGFGAYPVGAKSRAGGGPTQPCPAPDSPEAAAATKYDYETIRNIDCHGTDFCVRVRDGMRYWNMTVQWWLAQYIYKSAPARSYVLRSAWTMLLSAYWHGIHPGYYLSFLTIPLCLAAEGCLESGLRNRLNPKAQQAWDWAHWFLKMRAYDYMCMGFVLLSLQDTLRYWASIYFCIHLLALAGLGLGLALGGGGPGRRGGGARAEAKTPPNKPPTPPDKLREE
ncbi:lysophospholipid acyltransferase 7 isoform X3 [Vombatus ursinus]|uniref:lysophospholipid acyltransferase 7 isoform X3 n=1 Tax=Vombatus ursinus TaxID=29139 RepID=UPI000FFDA747|nr:lysophospholipid acyltransferase 7 isoform X3 [Vombatus ursinus]